MQEAKNLYLALDPLAPAPIVASYQEALQLLCATTIEQPELLQPWHVKVISGTTSSTLAQLAAPLSGTPTSETQALALASVTEDGQASANELVSTKGLAYANGQASENSQASTNGLASTNGQTEAPATERSAVTAPITLVGQEAYERKKKAKKNSLWEQLAASCPALPSVPASTDVLIYFGPEGASLCLLDAEASKLSPLRLDFEEVAYRQRLLRGGRTKEAVARAVLQGLPVYTLVFDATAGLGRESMILAHAGARVYSFERQLPIWLLLHDAFARAKRSRFFPFTLPQLERLGTIAHYQGELKPEVIYYDPMFPEKKRTAQVKKGMFIFQQVVGSDSDALEFLQVALTMASKRVVVKRPHDSEPLSSATIKCAYSVDGGQCRFDCYTVLPQ